MIRMCTTLATVALLAACSSGDKGEPSQRDKIGHSWQYEQGEGGKPKLAYIGSTNAVPTMTAPDTFAVMLVQPMSNGEKTVTIKLVGAPFQCDLSACAVSASRDDGKRYSWTGRLTEGKDGIEIPPSQNAYEAIAKARTVKVDLKVGPKDESAAFQFDVAGLTLPE